LLKFSPRNHGLSGTCMHWTSVVRWWCLWDCQRRITNSLSAGNYKHVLLTRWSASVKW